MAKTLTVDMTGTTIPQNSYNLKGVTTLVIKTQGNDKFLNGIKSVTASGGTFTVTVNVKEIGNQDFSINFLPYYQKILNEAYLPI